MTAAELVPPEIRSGRPFFDVFPILNWITPLNTDQTLSETSLLWYTACGIGERKHIVEIGCQRGLSSMVFLLAARDYGHTLFFIDPWGGSTYPELFEADLVANAWFSRARHLAHPFTLHHGKTGDLDWRQRPREIDLLYIDGDHTEESVEIDCRLIANVLPGGLVMVHDYGFFPDVAKVVDRHIQEGEVKFRSLVGTMLTLEKI